MKHYVLGFVFNRDASSVLLVEKQKPDWMKGRLNGIGGKVEKDESFKDAMEREGHEETHFRYRWKQAGIFICPGGTVAVFKAFYPSTVIAYQQIETEPLGVHRTNDLPDTAMANLKWLIPLCLSNTKPFLIEQLTLGVE